MADRAKSIRLAAEALSDLNGFHAIIAICEGGIFRTPSYEVTSRIIKICMAEAQRRLRDYDRHTAAAKRDG